MFSGKAKGKAEANRTAPPKLVPNTKYRLTRQMYLFPRQEVTSDVNDYLEIGAVVTYVNSGGPVEFNGVTAPWVYVRSERKKKKWMGKGREGWCFAHFLAEEVKVANGKI
jgi:hypothetical protein